MIEIGGEKNHTVHLFRRIHFLYLFVQFFFHGYRSIAINIVTDSVSACFWCDGFKITYAVMLKDSPTYFLNESFFFRSQSRSHRH